MFSAIALAVVSVIDLLDTIQAQISSEKNRIVFINDMSSGYDDGEDIEPISLSRWRR